MIPNVDKNYLRFIKQYTIIDNDITPDNIYKINLRVTVDSLGLTDSIMFNRKPTNSVIFSYSGIDYIYLNREIMDTILRKELLNRQFVLKDQAFFDYNIKNSTDLNTMIVNFDDLNAKYFFQFEFIPIFSSLKNNDNLCELLTQTTIHSKISRGTSLKIETSSKNKNPKLCLEEAVNLAVSQTLDYIRLNKIQPNTILDEEYNYNLIATNFSNMIVVNNFLSKLKNRGYITKSIIKSFTPQEIIIELTSVLDTDMLLDKISVLFNNQNLNIANTSTNLFIDFGN